MNKPEIKGTGDAFNDAKRCNKQQENDDVDRALTPGTVKIYYFLNSGARNRNVWLTAVYALALPEREGRQQERDSVKSERATLQFVLAKVSGAS